MNAIKPRPAETPTCRCPYCHDAVALERRDWVTCARCQARHHRACLRECASCASCGEARFLGELDTDPHAIVFRRESFRALQWVLFLVGGLLLVAGAGAVGVELALGRAWGERGNLLCLGIGLILPAGPALFGWLALSVTRAVLDGA